MLTTSNTTVTAVVYDDDKKTVKLQLPPCSSEFLRHYNLYQVTGCFKNKRWNSLICSHSLNSFKSISTALTNKTLYFFGDSTITQFFMLMAVEILQLTIKGSNSDIIWQQPRIAYSDSSQNHNITMYYRAHGPPLRNPGPPSSRPYISDSILSISVGG